MRHICSGAYANNVKCMYTSVSSHIVDCSGSTRGMYTDIVVSCTHEKCGIHVVFVAFEGHITIWHVNYSSMLLVT